MWKYRRVIPSDVRVCCGQVNRGVAILGDLVYIGTVDAHLVALNAQTGAVHWEAGNETRAEGIAPGILFGGTNEGQVYALPASSGKPLWRFQTGGAARSNPISYLNGGKQYIALTMGNALHVFGLD